MLPDRSAAASACEGANPWAAKTDAISVAGHESQVLV
jgi:hypothetical protein